MDIEIEIVQFEPLLGRTSDNIEKIDKYIDKSDSQIIVFPELASSGYYYTDKEELAKVAINSEDQLIVNFQELAEQKNQIIVFGFPEIDEGKFYNSAAIITPDKDLSSIYRKSHLFYKEHLVFEPGDTGFFNIYFEDFDLNLGAMICYDWRFPEAARTLALQGSDLILCPSNLVTGVWQEVMRSRALENKTYIAVANRIGSEKKAFEELTFNGESSIISYNGKPMVTAGESNEISIKTVITPNKTRNKSFNEHNDIFKDRRPELYQM